MSKGKILNRLKVICTKHANVHRNTQFDRTDDQMAKWCGASVRMVTSAGSGLLNYSQIKRRLDSLVDDGLVLKVWSGPGSIAFYWPYGLAAAFAESKTTNEEGKNG